MARDELSLPSEHQLPLPGYRFLTDAGREKGRTEGQEAGSIEDWKNGFVHWSGDMRAKFTETQGTRGLMSVCGLYVDSTNVTLPFLCNFVYCRLICPQDEFWVKAGGPECP